MVLKTYKIKSPLPRFLILQPRKDIYKLLLLNCFTEKQKFGKIRRFSVVRWNASRTAGGAEVSVWWRGICGDIDDMR